MDHDLSSIIVILDADGRISVANEVVGETLGHAPEQLVGREASELFHPEDLDAGRDLLSGGRPGTSSRLQARLRHVGGEWVWMEVNVQGYSSAAGRGGALLQAWKSDGREESAGEDLKASEANYRALIDDLPELVCRSLPDLRRIYVNEGYCRYFGKSREELLGRSFLDLLPEEDREPLMEHLALLNQENPVGSFEHRVWRHDGEVRWQQWTNRAVFDEENNFTGYQSVGRDSNVRRLAEEALKASEERFRSLVDATFEGICISEEGEVLETNQAFADMFGYELAEIRGMSVLEFVAHEHREQAWQRFSSGFEGSCESVGLRKDGTTFYTEARAKTGTYGERAIHVAAVRDISERKRVEAELKENERRFRSLIQNASDVVTIFEADGTITYESPAIERVLGYRPEERIGKNALDYVHPDDRRLSEDSIAEALANPGQVLRPVELRLRHKDGSWRHIEATRTNLLEDSAIKGVVSNSRDVTERKEAEEKLREGEERYRAVMEQTGDGIYLFDGDSKRILETNPSMRKMFGYTAEEFVGMDLYTLVAHDREDVDSAVRRDLEEGRRRVGERKYRRKDGSLVDVEVGVSKISYSGKEVVCNVVRDITERKEAEERLRESETRFRSAFEDAPIGVALVGLDGRRFWVNQALCEMLGYPEEELIGRHYLENVHPGERDVSAQYSSSVLSEGVGSYIIERRYLHANGHAVWNLTSVSLMTDFRGEPSHFFCIHQDTTERREAEDALRESRAKFQAVFENAAIGLALVDMEGRFTKTNPAMQDILGYSDEELRGMTWVDVTYPEDVELDMRHFKRLVADDINYYQFEKRYVRKDGRLVWGRLTGSVILGAEDKPRLMVGMVEDITERKRAEDILRRSEERYRAVVERTADGIFLVDISGHRILESNAALREMLGYSADELGEMTLYDIVADERESIDCNTWRVIEERSFLIGERQYRCKNGSLVDVETSATLIPYGDQEATCFIARDITERKTLEEQLRHQAFHDSLTGLPNRALFLDRLGHTLARISREGGPIAVLFVDLDDFKGVNDSMGHDAGNALLVEVSERLRKSVRPGDTVARIFGDEFTVLLETPADAEEARRVAERIGERLRQPFDIQGQEVYVSSSIGIALGETVEDRPEDLMRHADLAMYAAKSRGKGRYEMYRPE